MWEPIWALKSAWAYIEESEKGTLIVLKTGLILHSQLLSSIKVLYLKGNIINEKCSGWRNKPRLHAKRKESDVELELISFEKNIKWKPKNDT